MTTTSFHYEYDQKENSRRQITPGSVKDIQVSGIRIPEVFVQLLRCCERAHHPKGVLDLGCWVFCLWDISTLRIPDEYLSESNPKLLSNLGGELRRRRFPQPEKENGYCFQSMINRTDSLIDKLSVQCPHFRWRTG
jgi:hypothetical protein